MKNKHAVALGKKRWENKNEKEKSEHGKMMRQKQLSTRKFKKFLTTASEDVDYNYE